MNNIKQTADTADKLLFHAYSSVETARSALLLVVQGDNTKLKSAQTALDEASTTLVIAIEVWDYWCRHDAPKEQHELELF